MVWSAALFCANGQKSEQTGKSGCGLLAEGIVFVTYAALYQITRETQTAGYFRAQAIEYMGRGGESQEMKINFLSGTIYLTLSSLRLRRPLVSAAAEKSPAAQLRLHPVSFA